MPWKKGNRQFQRIAGNNVLPPAGSSAHHANDGHLIARNGELDGWSFECHDDQC
jgi:hypothetical protein